jgi:hypothetical protein
MQTAPATIIVSPSAVKASMNIRYAAMACTVYPLIDANS